MDTFNLQKYLEAKKAFIDKALGALIPPAAGHASVLNEAMRYSLFAGGKRLRPVLTLASAEAVGGDIGAALNTACAIECIHTYSLIHDDLPALDDDDLRRGRATCHKEYGEAMAILAGDALLTSAFEMIAGSPLSDAGALVKVIGELAAGAGHGGMIGGQVVDLESEGLEISLPELEYIHTHKTGRLILASVRCGAILGGASAGELAALTEYAEASGLAFQILDDILDVEGSPEELGKAVGGDADKGKATYPSLLGLVESKALGKELVDSAIKAIEGFGESAEPLRQIAFYIISRRS
ncbi:MAG: polyprenyl synthetase family protein [Thermodesulfobacteriota bacterium]